MNRDSFQVVIPNERDRDGRFLLCVPLGWDTYITREFYEIHEHLVAQGWTKLIIGKDDELQIVEAIERAEIVLLWEAYELLEQNEGRLCTSGATSRNRAKRVFFCDDVHHFTPLRRQQRARAYEWADLILATYPDKLAEWFPEISTDKVKWVPHSAASYFYPASSEERSSDQILLSGSRTWPYPFRQFCAEKLAPEVCAVVGHPGYPGYPGNRANTMKADAVQMQHVGQERYGDVLRSYPAMLACGSVFGFLVAKVFEGMAVGALMICDKPSLAHRLSALGFVDGVHFISTDILNVIADSTEVHEALRRRDPALAGIAARASDMVLKKHTTLVRAVEIHNLSIGAEV